MVKVFAYILLFASLNVTASDEIELDLSEEPVAPKFLANPFTVVLASDCKNQGDKGYCSNYFLARDTTFILQFAHEGEDYHFFPNGRTIRIAIDKRKYEELYGILFLAQQHKKMLEIDSIQLNEDRDIYTVPFDKPINQIVRESTNDARPFDENTFTSFRCPKRDITPITSLFNQKIIIGYNIAGHILYSDLIHPQWKKALENISQLDGSKEIRIRRYIDDPRKFFNVHPRLVFEETGEQYSEEGNELTDLID